MQLNSVLLQGKKTGGKPDGLNGTEDNKLGFLYSTELTQLAGIYPFVTFKKRRVQVYALNYI